MNFPSTAVVHRQFNFHIVAPGIWRSSATNKRSLKRMKKHGLKSVLNLRRNKLYHKTEQSNVERLNLEYFYYPMDPKVPQAPDTLKEILGIISNPDNQPILIHCQSGKDRAGLIAALYRLEYEEAPFDQVYKELLLYGYDEKKYPAIVETIRSWSAPVSKE